MTEVGSRAPAGWMEQDSGCRNPVKPSKLPKWAPKEVESRKRKTLRTLQGPVSVSRPNGKYPHSLLFQGSLSHCDYIPTNHRRVPRITAPN